MNNKKFTTTTKIYNNNKNLQQRQQQVCTTTTIKITTKIIEITITTIKITTRTKKIKNKTAALTIAKGTSDKLQATHQRIQMLLLHFLYCHCNFFANKISICFFSSYFSLLLTTPLFFTSKSNNVLNIIYCFHLSVCS